MAKFMKTLKDKFTPHIVTNVHQQGVALTILWVSGIFLTLGFALALFCLYSRVMILEQAVTVLGAR
jgi:hypothetical protein